MTKFNPSTVLAQAEEDAASALRVATIYHMAGPRMIGPVEDLGAFRLCAKGKCQCCDAVRQAAYAFQYYHNM